MEAHAFCGFMILFKYIGLGTAYENSGVGRDEKLIMKFMILTANLFAQVSC